MFYSYSCKRLISEKGSGDIIIYFVSASILLLAVIWDYKECKIPNMLIVIGWAAGLICTVNNGGKAVIPDRLAGALLPVAVLMILFKIRVLGAGDIKLISVMGMFYGVKSVTFIIIYSFIMGAVVALIKMIYKRNLVIRLQYLANYFINSYSMRKVSKYEGMEDESSIIHFSLCIAFATVFIIFDQNLLH